jgi:secreted trypsin-like serine protease
MRLSNTRCARIAVLLTGAALLFTCAPPAAAITWGTPDGEGHPNVGAMMIQDPDSGQWFQGCSGTLIHPYIVLTAGHCTDWAETFEDNGDTHVRVNFAQNALDFSDSSTWREVEFVITHPEYDSFRPRSNVHDVGVLILKEPVLDRACATLAEEGLLNDLVKQKELRQGKEEADFVVVGYGATLHWPPAPPDPKITYENQRQVAESEYQALLPAWLLMSQNHATGDGGTSFGDSGGPAFWIDPDSGQEILVGLTSWGDAQCVATGMDYRVDLPDTLHFIDDMTELAANWLESED